MELSYIFSKQVFLIFREMELFGSKIKKFLIFSQKKIFLYFGKWNFLGLRFKNFRREYSELKKLKKKKHPEKNFLHFRNETVMPQL